MTALPRGWTIGAELELADCRRDTQLAGRSTWDRKDYTIVNSNGVANDPTGRLWPFGGEVNTEPTSTVGAQVDVIAGVLRSVSPAPAVNYRSNFHVHLRVPGLADDVPAVHRVLRYCATHGRRAFELVDPLPPKPTAADVGWDVYAGALARWRRRSMSHHALLSPRFLRAALAAQTPEAIRVAHAPISKGKPQYHLAPRCGVNVRALWETPGQTVEFRHFCLSLDVAVLADAMRWCVLFLQAALDGGPGPDDLLWDGARFPMQPLYDHWLETRYRATSSRYHQDATIRATLAQWEAEGTLYDTRTRGVHGQPVQEPAPGALF
jgi:hypothetical protein